MANPPRTVPDYATVYARGTQILQTSLPHAQEAQRLTISPHEILWREKLGELEEAHGRLLEDFLNYERLLCDYLGVAATRRVGLNDAISVGIYASLLSSQRESVRDIIRELGSTLTAKKQEAFTRVALAIATLALVVSTVSLVLSAVW